MNNKWYAVMTDPDDNDWGTGSFDKIEAEKMVTRNLDIYPAGYIAVIENDTCVEEIHPEDFSLVYTEAARIMVRDSWYECLGSLEMLMMLLGLSDEWKQADGDTFISVIDKAGKMIGVPLV